MYIRAPSSLFQKVAYWQPVTVKWSPSPDFRQNFGRQKFFLLAMATKIVAAWSAVYWTTQSFTQNWFMFNMHTL